ncbi:MAG TPA: hypothetical protein VFL77_04705 [Solirubrobacterales bacterium]|nr:hypothetical protein [Solirubrobacterales bacterium]
MVAASAIPPAAPTSAAPPATSGTFALLATFPAALTGPAPFELLRDLDPDPFELDDFELAPFGFELFLALGFDCDFGLGDEPARFGAAGFFAFDLV